MHFKFTLFTSIASYYLGITFHHISPGSNEAKREGHVAVTIEGMDIFASNN